jgi:CDP-glucose 4,6-dehydratase
MEKMGKISKELPRGFNAGPWKGLNVFITGISGFLGSRMAEILHDMGARVYGIDYQYRSCLHFGRAVSYIDDAIWEDIRDYKAVERALAEFKPDVVFHLAAITQVVDATRMPLQAYETNIMGTANILEAVRKQAGPKIPVVVASSDKAYGRIETLPADESTPLNPIHPYDVSKASADFIARSYAEIYEQKVAVVRCGNIYGPNDSNWQRIVPGTIRSMLLGEKIIIRSDGTYRREFNYIDDIIEAYLLIAQNLKDGFDSGVAWPVSDPFAVLNVLEVVKAIGLVMGIEPDLSILGGAQEEEKELTLNSWLITSHLGWHPRTNFPDGLKKTIKWVKWRIDK